MSESEGTPRVLRISFEFRVPRALKRNIHGSRVEKALDALTERVLGLAEAHFPWASEVVVRKEWLYDWIDERETHLLAATEYNSAR